jgi:cytochrome c2
MNVKKAAAAIACAAALSLVAAGAMAEENEAKGRELISALGCKGCHQFDGSGGKLGPNLDEVGQRLDEEALRKVITDPKSVNPGTMMPAYDHLKSEEIDALVEFLSNQ